MRICLVTAKGAPGASTSALAMAMVWPCPVLLVEADPAGSDLRTGFLQGAPVGERTLVGLATTARHGISAADVARHCLSLEAEATTRLVLPGPPTPFHGAVLEPVWPLLLEAVSQLRVRDPLWAAPVDLVVDGGRLDHPYLAWPLVEAADLVVVVCRATLPSIAAARAHTERLRERLTEGAQVVGLVIESGAYTPAEVGRAGIEVAATLPYDVAATRVFSERAAAPRGFHRSAFMRGVHAAVAALRARVQHPASPADMPSLPTSTLSPADAPPPPRAGARGEGVARVGF